MTAQTRPDEMIRILRAEFTGTAGSVGAACVVHTCGATGWRAAGGTITRTLVHETAFQLDTGGNARGSYAIDLQQSRFFVTEVAQANFSAILSGEENRIGGINEFSSEYSTVIGAFNSIIDSSGCHVVGSSNTLTNDVYQAIVLGEAINIDDGDYIFAQGNGHDLDDPFGCFTLGESNELRDNVNDYPTYSGNVGIFNAQEGDTWFVHQFGEENAVYGLGTPGDAVLWAAQFGFGNYLGHVQHNYAFGANTRSYRPTHDGFYDGRIVFSGDFPNSTPAANPPAAGSGFEYGSGFNQDSWFAQNDRITAWAAAWTTSRFEFPIIEDSTWYFQCILNGTEPGCANSYTWELKGTIENDGGNTTLLWSAVTNHYRDVVTKEWQVIADNVNDRLVFQFRDTAGADPTDCNIQMSMFTVEVGFV